MKLLKNRLGTISILLLLIIVACGVCVWVAPDTETSQRPPTEPAQPAVSALTEAPIESPTPEPTSTPTAASTATPEPTATDTPEPLPTNTPLPTATPIIGPKLVIIEVNDSDEFVDIQNIGSEAQDLAGWRLFSENGEQDCPLAGLIEPDQTLRIWARSQDDDKEGFNCRYDGNIWNNEEQDTAILFDASGAEIDRR